MTDRIDKTLMDYLREAREWREREDAEFADKGRPPTLPWAERFEDGVPPPAQEWAIRDRIPNQQVALYSGEGAAGKSSTALHLCAAHVLGRDWLGSMPELGPAWFLDAEDGLDVIHRRLEAIRSYYGTTFAEMYAGGLAIMSLVGQDCLLATCTRNGLINRTPFYDQLLAAAAELKPKMIAIASLANVFGGSELDRSQVQQFVAMLRRIAVAANGAVLLIAHPSLTGISTDTGLSGSTQWHNAVRARLYLKGIKPENGEPADSDLRALEFRKNQYGPAAHTVVLRWKDGLFLPEGSGDPLEKLAREARADETFLRILARFHASARTVTDHPTAPSNYAPRVFAKEPEGLAAHLTKADLEAAMARLFQSNRIRIHTWGPPSRQHRGVVLA